MAGQDLRTLIEAPHRRPANIARNAARHPVETLEFFGLAADLIKQRLFCKFVITPSKAC